jgi:hypothetical protein
MIRRALCIGALFLLGCPKPAPAPREAESGAGTSAQPQAPAPPTAPPENGSTGAPPSAPPAAPPENAQAPAPPVPKPRPAKIKITVRSNPPKAYVRWGKKVLGQTPVILERPRDSGPVDLVVFAEGFFPVHTRAYTFHNDAIAVRLTKLEDRMTLFGAKKELEAPPAEAPPPALSPDAPPPETPPPAIAPLAPQAPPPPPQ